MNRATSILIAALYAVQHEPRAPVIYHRTLPRGPRNKPCPCGSKKKYKVCCFLKQDQPETL